MAYAFENIELVKRAQLGDRVSIGRLSELIKGRLHAYIYRIMLIDDVCDDLVQECLLDMVKGIEKLENAESFWPWLRQIAFNKIKHKFLENRRFRPKNEAERETNGNKGFKESECGLSALVTEELKKGVMLSIQRMKPQHRSILVMRCYEEMSYREIAETTGCSELSSRVLFYRAKKELENELGKNGFDKKMLMTAISWFGKMTAESMEAVSAVKITAATVSVGATAFALGYLGTTGIKASFTAAGLIVVTMMGMPLAEKGVSFIKEIKQFWFSYNKQVKQEHIEKVYFYPDGINGPLMTKAEGAIAKLNDFENLWYLQNENGNYYYDQKANVLYLRNGRMNFGQAVFDNINESRKCDSKGLVIYEAGSGGQIEKKIFNNNNMLSEEYFCYDFPKGAGVTDERDNMHRQGRAYYKLAGQINGHKLTGSGIMPFVYSKIAEYRPNMKITVENGWEIIDSSDGIQTSNISRKIKENYRAGSLGGICRPWLGYSCCDLLLCDAKRAGLDFSITSDENHSEVTIAGGDISLKYFIDTKQDLVKRIDIYKNSERKIMGYIEYSYFEQADNFEIGSVSMDEEDVSRYCGLDWLFMLCKDKTE